jgi:2-hydroxycyclohexanecarboxyl-CoA dehydrogenase
VAARKPFLETDEAFTAKVLAINLAGPTDTPLFQGMAESGGQSEKVVASLKRAIPMRRLGRPSDISPAVAFLASRGAGYITGQTLSVSGGLTMV